MLVGKTAILWNRCEQQVKLQKESYEKFHCDNYWFTGKLYFSRDFTAKP
jgi:hypothetical protein